MAQQIALVHLGVQDRLEPRCRLADGLSGLNMFTHVLNSTIKYIQWPNAIMAPEICRADKMNWIVRLRREMSVSADMPSTVSESHRTSDQPRQLSDAPEVDENRPPGVQHRWLRTRGRFSRTSFGRGTLLSSSRVYSSGEEGQHVAVISVVGTIAGIQSNSNTVTESATQATPPTVTCTAEARMACKYIDKLVAAEQTDGESVPTEFLCPITHHAMNSPFAASDGFTYEHSAIQRWMCRSNHSPMTREVLRDDVLVRNRALEQIMIRWARDHAKQGLNRGIQ